MAATSRGKHGPAARGALVTLILSLVLQAQAQPQLQQAAAAADTIGQLESDSNKQQHPGVVSFLLASSQQPQQQATSGGNKTASQQQQQQQQILDSMLANVLARVGPDIKPTSGHRDPADISVELARRAWQLMRDHARLVVSRQLAAAWPQVDQLLRDANVSSKCLAAAGATSLAASKLDAWAIQLLNSWGQFPPAGMFEGTLGDIGSYHGCVDVPENAVIGHAHYCTVAYRPVLPTRRDYELIIRQEPARLVGLFDGSDAFGKLLQKAQYNHYVYYKLGTCFPIDCSPNDVQQVAQLMGRRAVLLSGPVKCHSKYANDYLTTSTTSSSSSSSRTGPDPGNATTTKDRRELILSSQDLNRGVYIWRPHVTGAQRVALLVLLSLAVAMLAVSLADLLVNRLPKVTFPSTPEAVERPTVVASVKQQDIKQVGGEDPNNNNNDDELVENFELQMTELRQSLDSPQTNGESLDIKEAASGNAAAAASLTRGRNKSPVLQLIEDCSLITNTREFFLVGAGQHKNDILCINGLRCITMSWIIVAHTMQYNDWSAFARIYEIEVHLRSLVNQPLFNASYLVDTFFLISGLLTSFSAFRTPAFDDLSEPKTGAGAAGGLGRDDDHNRDHNRDHDHDHDHDVEQDPMCQEANHSGTRNTNRARAGGQHKSIKEILTKFSCRTYLVGRYLRLTPQILLVSLMFIVLPLVSPAGGPHWYSMTGEYSENCAKNWWVNLLHIQAFYRSDEMCNFVCWWISVDMFYHLFALLVILTILRYGRKISLKLCAGLALLTGLWQARKHYQMGLPPNLLSTIPQTGAMWSQMTLGYFWRPEAHTFPFLFGFYLGFLMAQHEARLRGLFAARPRLAPIGWLATMLALASVSFGTHPWIVGAHNYTNTTATCYYLASQVVWSLCLAYIIVACHYGHGGFVDRILSCKLFIILGKASYIVYLSHFLVLFTFFGSQNLLLEPTQLLMLYVIIGNICLSMMFGSFLCIAFEMPWLKIQKRIMRKIR